MRILAYNWRDLTHPQAGGAEVYLQSVGAEWVRSGHDVTIFCAAVAGRPSEEFVDGVRMVRRGGRLGVSRQARRYWNKEGQGNYDLVIDSVNTRPFFCPRFVKDTPVVAIIYQVAREVWGYETPWPISAGPGRRSAWCPPWATCTTATCHSWSGPAPSATSRRTITRPRPVPP